MSRLRAGLAEVGKAVGQLASRFINRFWYKGSIHQSVSARSYQMSFNDPEWAARRVAIDHRLGENHCREAWNYEVDNALNTLKQNGMIP
ncbi:hypothetical protein [Cereibacter changlensis]|uniref:hypothetical protein n=1 Tax=Cereibacter changlensis TaxID=402884 RepID=UPI0040347F01